MSIAPSSLLESGAVALATMVKLFMKRNTNEASPQTKKHVYFDDSKT